MASQLPRFIVIKSFDKIGYLSYIHEGGEADGYLRFMEPEVTAPFAKFEVESSETDGLVHIRSCRNNKYWQRTYLPHVPWGPWTAATSKEKEEDKSKEWCTLFMFIPVDPANNKFRIKHVQSGSYLSSPAMEDKKFDHGLLAHNKEFDHQSADVFIIIDWSLLLILPRHVAFKFNVEDVTKYICPNKDSLMCIKRLDVGDPSAACEILPANDRDIRIKSSKTGKLCRCDDSGLIWADEPSADNADTLFSPVITKNQKILLKRLSDNYLCGISPRTKYGDVFGTTTSETLITVEEPVLKRETYDFKYDVDHSRVDTEPIIVVAHNSVTNITNKPSIIDVKLGYQDTKSSCWKTDMSLKLDTKTTMELDVPLILNGCIGFSTQVQPGVEWGKVFETTTDLEVVHKVAVPPMSTVTVNLVTTKGQCEVPFTFMQRDTMYDGISVVRAIQGGTYYGSNYHSMKFEVRAEMLPKWS